MAATILDGHLNHNKLFLYEQQAILKYTLTIQGDDNPLYEDMCA